MTTVVYHKGILAADSRSTTIGVEHNCIHCEKRGPQTQDSGMKVHLPGKAKFRNEKVLAISAAGNAIALRMAIKAFKKGVDIEAAYVTMCSLIPMRTRPQYTLLIVTDKSIYTLSARQDDEYNVTIFKIEDTIIIGSGKPHLTLAMKLIEMTAIEAVMAAMVTDEGTGGSVHWIDCNPAVEDVIQTATPGDKDLLIKTIRSQNQPPEVVAPVKPARARAKPVAK